ncbi:hypothetical protein ACFRMN_07895 [Streptomyces sp. NPDC056835]|uniref:hypothetical protein n=1 Tax=Streptomyces sp. NPDC056835 TaxID=3345956 RepID=UPI0036C50A3E
MTTPGQPSGGVGGERLLGHGRSSTTCFITRVEVSCAIVHLAVGVLARTVLKTRRPSAARAVTRASGAMMIAIGGFLLVEGLTG